ncbi:hypothetical protein [Streptomyces sp. NPDC127072]|uniref:hypothetical protein n=1 Tax=Streptomyces sp. NPDC127072 TaxID=3347129 RepID=UPI003650CE56
MTDLLVREMTLPDCLRVSGIRIRGWRNAYAGLLPQPYEVRYAGALADVGSG